jgi:cytochrome c oxidase subunit 3
MSQAIATPVSAPIDRGLLGLLMFIGAEIMMFAGFISACVVLRAGSAAWPPAGEPRLPLGVTAVNTLVLLASAVTFSLALRAVKRGRQRHLQAWLTVTALLGVTFLAVQGYEWSRLIGFGLSIGSSVYGGVFYTLIGAHGLHVAAAVIALFVVLARSLAGGYDADRHSGVMLCQVYWLFVVALWPLLYYLVYLA